MVRTPSSICLFMCFLYLWKFCFFSLLLSLMVRGSALCSKRGVQRVASLLGAPARGGSLIFCFDLITPPSGRINMGRVSTHEKDPRNGPEEQGFGIIAKSGDSMRRRRRIQPVPLYMLYCLVGWLMSCIRSLALLSRFVGFSTGWPG